MLMIYPQPSSVDLSKELGPELGMGDMGHATISLPLASQTPWPIAPISSHSRDRSSMVSLTAGARQSWEHLLP